MDEDDLSGSFVWEPTSEIIERAHVTHFLRQNDIPDFDTLIDRAGRDVGWFTEALLDYLDIRFRKPYDKILDLERGIAWPQWCVGAEMNIIDNCLDKRIGTPLEHETALMWESEEGPSRSMTYAELNREVNRAANALRGLGLGRGDAVGLYMPLIPEEVIACLAVVKIGGIILPLFSGYGPGAVASRLADGGAKALITTDGAMRRGRVVPMKPSADAAAADVPSLEHILVVKRTGEPVDMLPGRDHWWDELVPSQAEHAETEATGADDPLMIIYTSGTTGRPKGAVHTHCGFPVKATQDMAFGMDVHPGDRIFWMTDMGWMMGPWLIFGTLLLGATMFLYDGAPDYPEPGRVWEMIERHSITQLGLSPTFIRALIPAGKEPVKAHDLSSLRSIGSTGETWNPDPWMWLFEVVGQRRVPIMNYTGGTELSGGILMGNPTRPIKPCALSAVCPGMAADVFDEDGQSLVGEVGELVIKAPWIGITRGFWKDPERYEATYWSKFPKTWVHGDWAMVDEDGQWYILGRSDDTMKIGGKRLGPAEVESILLSHPSVVSAAAIGVPDPIKGTAVVCFCVLFGDCDPDQVKAELGQWIVRDLGKPFAPKAILFVPDLPRTRNAKLMRRMLRSAYLGEDPGDTSALVNPDSLEAIRKTAL
jgi:acetyl-CoA synthetase